MCIRAIRRNITILYPNDTRRRLRRIRRVSIMLKWLNNAEDQGRIGITCGAFDLLHAGHIAMLAEAKSNCDYLIVAVQSDPSLDRRVKNSPVQSLFERQLQMSACRYVDDVVCYQTESELEDIFLTLPINVRIIGDDYRDKDFTAKEICIDRGIDIVYNSRAHSFSTSGLRKRVYQHDQDEKIRVEQQRQRDLAEYDKELMHDAE